MDLKELGDRLRMIRKHLGINQQQLARATKLTQPAISRLENGEEIYASALLGVLGFYRERVSLDHLFDPDLDTGDKSLLYCSRQELLQRHDRQLAAIVHELDKCQKLITNLRNHI